MHEVMLVVLVEECHSICLIRLNRAAGLCTYCVSILQYGYCRSTRTRADVRVSRPRSPVWGGMGEPMSWIRRLLDMGGSIGRSVDCLVD